MTSVRRSGSHEVIALEGAGPANHHEACVLLTPFDRIESSTGGGPGSPRRVGARRSVRACRALVAAHGGWLALRAAERADMDVLPYQLEPALAVLRGGACRVLLADAVGLGKTLQAGLLLAELMARGAARHALVLTPAGLRDQWAGELSGRFGLSPAILDLVQLHALAGRLPPGANPWSTTGLAIASLDFVKRPEVLPLARARGWDVVVVDEAHLVSPASDRHAAVSALCTAAAFVVLVTATPHNGDRAAFDALRALGGRDDPLLVFRRTRADVALPSARRMHRLRIAATPAETRLQAALERYASAVVREAGVSGLGVSGPGDAVAHGRLVAMVLRKRALSTAHSLRRTVARRLESLEATTGAGSIKDGSRKGGAWEDASRKAGSWEDGSWEDDGDRLQLWLPWDDGTGEFDGSDEAPVLSRPVLNDAARERRLLRLLLDAADAAVSADSKLRVLGRLLRRLSRLGESVLVFTEYRDTLLHLHATLGREAALLHGGMTREERRDALEAFTSGRCPLLLATDAGGEGLNLHARCRCIVHLELPWNPVRLEQRIGRVDRIGQRRVVHGFHLLRDRTFEVRIADAIQRRLERARLDISTPDPFGSARAVPPRERPEGSEPAADAAQERHRILLARALQPPDTDAGIAIGRARRRLRAVLGGRTLALVSATARDTFGREVARHVSGLLIEVESPSGGLRADDLLSSAALASALERERARLLRSPSEEARQAFWRTSTTRARAIARAVEREPVGPYQPGLFERRADRLRQQLEHERQALQASTGQRWQQYEAAGHSPVITVATPLLIASKWPGWANTPAPRRAFAAGRARRRR
ncbi:MAG: DEAD/DEAH box helicase [Vicinamibacterales bacterium]